MVFAFGAFFSQQQGSELQALLPTMIMVVVTVVMAFYGWFECGQYPCGKLYIRFRQQRFCT